MFELRKKDDVTCKAIILLELDSKWLDINNFNIDELLADITLYHNSSLKRQCDYRQRIYRCFSRLKPMPKKKEIEKYDTWHEMFRAEALNDIIDEISGEQ